MQLSIQTRLIKTIFTQSGSKNKFLKAALRYGSDDSKQKIDLNDLTPEEVQIARDVAATGDRHHKWVSGQIKLYQNLQNMSGAEKVKKLKDLPTALKSYIMPSEHKWVYMDEEDDSLLPYFVSNITYHPTERDRYGNVTPQYVSVEMNAYKRGNQTSRRVVFREDDIKFDLATMLHRRNVHLETPEVNAEYAKELEKAKLWVNQTGAQFIASGTARSLGERSWYSQSLTSMERDGRPSKVIIDDDGNAEENDRRHSKSQSDTVSSLFWGSAKQRQKAKFQKDEDGDEFEDEDGVTDEALATLPIHPYVCVFDLEKHGYVEINVQHLEPYKYDKTLISKLVLSEEKKSLINTLVSGSQENIEDIVAGKMAGVIVLATGEPGIGKTLTAEVFSEEIEKPLYVVQCSQLGLDIETIEGNLSKVLGRAQRWGAILLIDEADVYIHERGNDMEQNAIIGVFLRVLEYYRGILFMTSNRGEIIDDAIMSRATAWIRYERPSPEELKEIWAVLSKQFRVTFKSDDIVGKLIALYPRMSGREVRNILKLTRLAHGGAAVAFDELKYFAGFQQLANAGSSK